MTLLPLVLPFAVLTLCAVHDVTSFKIPNRYVAVLLAGWPVLVLTTGVGFAEAGLSAAIGGVVLLVGFALFAFRLLGAGDVKLLAATSLWVAPAQMTAFVLFTAVLGGLLGLFLMIFRARPMPVFAYGAPWLVQLHERARAMPYGVAIAGGAMIALARGVGAG